MCVVKSLRLITFVERSVVNADRSECNHVLGGGALASLRSHLTDPAFMSFV